MEKKRRTTTLFHFPGITVIVPVQTGVQIKAIDKGPVDLQKTDGFTPIRQIANIALVDKEAYEHDETIIVHEFAPPIKIRVGYNIEDVMMSGCDIRNLKLAYWDDSHWVIISNAEYKYMILPPSTAQVAEATLSFLDGDPPIAWGK
jgi:hypothetical protein